MVTFTRQECAHALIHFIKVRLVYQHKSDVIKSFSYEGIYSMINFVDMDDKDVDYMEFEEKGKQFL